MQMKKHLLLITTGGTIAMKWDPFTGVALPAKSGKELLAAVPQVNDFAELELIEFSNIDSTEMTPKMMFQLARLVQQHLARPGIQGVIITHGTDTLEETAYLLDLVVDSPKPVVCTAAMRSFNELGTDGPRNLLAAVKVACADNCRELGSLVVLNDEIHAGREVRKTYTSNVATFESVGAGPLGVVDEDRVLVYRRSVIRENIATEQIEDRVVFIEMVAGDRGEIIEFAIQNQVKGLVIAGLGRGNIPALAAEKVCVTMAQHIPVVLTSRCWKGRVLGIYGGSGKQMRESGVIFGGDLSGPKARIKLMLALGKTRDLREIRELFEAKLY
jgi:L-asparaginase